jgi:acetyl esterase
MKTSSALRAFPHVSVALALTAMACGEGVPFTVDLSQMDADSIAYLKSRPPAPATRPAPEVLKEEYRVKRLVTQPELPQVDRVKEYEATGPHGAIPVRIYRGAGTAQMGALPVLVYYHGGGWMLGDLDSHDWLCRMLANAAQCAVVNVDYRLAPQHVFPAAFDDALAAAHWVAANAATLRIDPARLAVGGDSAGGNLAAAVALALRDEGHISLRAQILIYPAVDLSMSGPYYGRFTKDVVLTDDAMRAFIAAYAPDAEQRKDWRASPLLAPSLKGLPPALVLMAGFDPLCAEDEAYAARLQQEGVPTTVKRYPGQMHGFLSNAKLLPKAFQAVEAIAAALKASW